MHQIADAFPLWIGIRCVPRWRHVSIDNLMRSPLCYGLCLRNRSHVHNRNDPRMCNRPRDDVANRKTGYRERATGQCSYDSSFHRSILRVDR
jgi:hypothetical protein